MQRARISGFQPTGLSLNEVKSGFQNFTLAPIHPRRGQGEFWKAGELHRNAGLRRTERGAVGVTGPLTPSQPR